MKKRNFTYDDVLNLIFKKASGYYYTEEQFEYEKTQKIKHLAEKDDIFANCSKKIDTIQTQISMFDDNIKSDNEKQKTYEKPENLTLVKKKVTTHYVSPDMLAIKILLEIFGEKVNNDNIDLMTDEELIKLKNKLIEEILNEDK